MTLRVAINGYGRIGRMVLRACFEGPHREAVEVVAVNDLGSADMCAHLTRVDSTHGRFMHDVEVQGDDLRIDDQHVQLFGTRDVHALPWADLGVDVVMECTGAFTKAEQARTHLDSGAGKVLISAPGKGVDATVVYGVNHHVLRAEHRIVSNASCTTNCLAPVAHVLHQVCGIERGVMNTIHAFTNDQVLLDVRHADMRRARSAVSSIIPTKTGAAQAVSLVLPELAGRLDGFALRVPVMNVSVVDLTFCPKKTTSVAAIHEAMEAAAQGALSGILDYNTHPLVSVDFNHHPASAIFDATQTKQIDNQLFKVLAWYDNEWAFSNRMVDTALAMHHAP